MKKTGWIYVDYRKAKEGESYRITLPRKRGEEGRKIYYALMNSDKGYGIAMSDGKSFWVLEENLDFDRNGRCRDKRKGEKRLRKFVDNRLVKLAGEYRTYVYDRCYGHGNSGRRR